MIKHIVTSSIHVFREFIQKFQFLENVHAENAAQEIYSNSRDQNIILILAIHDSISDIQFKILPIDYHHGTVIFGSDLGTCHIKSQFYSTLSFKGPSISCKILAFFIVTCSM